MYSPPEFDADSSSPQSHRNLLRYCLTRRYFELIKILFQKQCPHITLLNHPPRAMIISKSSSHRPKKCGIGTGHCPQERQSSWSLICPTNQSISFFNGDISRPFEIALPGFFAFEMSRREVVGRDIVPLG